MTQSGKTDFQIPVIVFADTLKGLAGYKNSECYLIAPIKPYLLWELRDAGFSNVLDLGNHWPLNARNYDEMQDHFKEHIRVEIGLKDSVGGNSWNNLNQPLMFAYVPLYFFRELLAGLRKKNAQACFELMIEDAELRMVIEEAIKGIW